MVRMTDEEARRLAEEIYGANGQLLPISNAADEKIPAATIDATGADAHISRSNSPPVKRGFWRRFIMGKKMTVEELDKHREQRRRSRALTVVPRTVAPTQVATSAPSAVAPLSSSTVHRLDNRDTVLHHRGSAIENQPVTISDRWYSNIPLHFAAIAFYATGIAMNAWYTYSQGSTSVAAWICLSLGVAADTTAFFLPDRAYVHCCQRRYGAFVIACLLCLVMFVFAFLNTSGFTAVNFSDTARARAERITPAITAAKAALDNAIADKNAECIKVGSICRQRIDTVNERQKKFDKARDDVAAEANPQAAKTAKLVAWSTRSHLSPSVEDIEMLTLLLFALLPLCGGLIRMIARRR